MTPNDERFRPVGMGWWVDPRICSVRVEGLRAYLEAHGWQNKPHARSEVLLFENVEDKGNGDVLCVSASEQASDFIQRLIETLTTLAAHEQRYAVYILDDILSPALNGREATDRTPPGRSARLTAS